MGEECTPLTTVGAANCSRPALTLTWLPVAAACRSQVVKYGVVSMPAFLQDLQHWSHLYVAGRLHKPVAVLASTPEADAAYQHNLRAALSTALLLLPKPESSLKVWQHAAAGA